MAAVSPHGALAQVAAERAAYREGLVGSGFADDGELLRGPVPWPTASGATATATVDVTLGDSFPFAPPTVTLVDAGAPLTVTFHRERTGALCLWDDSQAPIAWTKPALLIDRIRGWLQHTEANWPGDDDCDLERYLPPSTDSRFMVYDSDALEGLSGCVRTQAVPLSSRVTILAAPRSTPALVRKAKRQPHRRDQHLAWIADLGDVEQPLTGWDDLAQALGPDGRDVRRLVMQGSVEYLMIKYRRGGRPGTLVVALRPHVGEPSVAACMSADTSAASRRLRSGDAAAKLAERSVAVVGCGAVGSHVADLLFRNGITRLTLIDHQIVRPGNVVRHLASDAHVGVTKVVAVRNTLLSTGLDGSGIKTVSDKVKTPEAALNLVAGHDVVIDATADERATALLRWAAEETQRPVVSVCVQRDGAIARADRFPTRGDESHLLETPADPAAQPMLRERGCGDFVSRTPPSAVVAAAELCVELVLDEVTLGRRLPATVLRVLSPQPDKPFTTLVTLTSSTGSGWSSSA